MAVHVNWDGVGMLGFVAVCLFAALFPSTFAVILLIIAATLTLGGRRNSSR